MRSAQNTPLVLLAIGIIAVGGLLMQWASNEVTKSPVPGSGVPGGQQIINHIETVQHSANVQAAGDYHIEAQIDKQGRIVLYIYGAKEKQLFPIPTTAPDMGMEASAVITGEGSEPLTVTARPVANDPSGMASRFVAELGRTVAMMEVGLSLTIPIEGRSYRLQWRPEHLIPGAQLADASMPAAVGDAEAQKLFLMPGGLYTQADIVANGSQTAMQKYGTQMSQQQFPTDSTKKKP